MAPPSPRRSLRRAGAGAGAGAGGGAGGGAVSPGRDSRENVAAVVSVLETLGNGGTDQRPTTRLGSPASGRTTRGSRAAAAVAASASASASAKPPETASEEQAELKGRTTRRRSRGGKPSGDDKEVDHGDGQASAADGYDDSPPIEVYTGRRRTKRPKTSAPACTTRSGDGTGRSSSSVTTVARKPMAKSRHREASERLLSRTRYEIEVDPYRGIYDSRHGFDPPTALKRIDTSVGCTTAAGEDGGDDDVVLVESGSDGEVMPTNPWGGCARCCRQSGIEVKLTPLDMDGNDNVELGGMIAESIVSHEMSALSASDAFASTKPPSTTIQLVPHCQCESRNKWADDAAEVERKRIKKARDKKAAREKGRKGRGLKRQRSIVSGAGAIAVSSGAGAAAVATDDDGDVVVVDDETEPAKEADDDQPVAAATDVDKAQIRISVMPVRRNADPNYFCPCDYNPLCLSSLGGAIDDLVHRKALDTARLELKECLRQQGINDDDDAIALDDSSGAGAAARKNGAANDGILRLRKSLSIEVESIRKHLASVVRPYAGGNTTAPTAATPAAATATCPEGESLADYTVDECIEMIHSMHKGLIYEERISAAATGTTTETDSSMDEATHAISIQLSTPAGLRNLGATCYLNSQFQCLAQNPAFVDGVFSWIAEGGGSGGGGGGSRMDQVLLTMQTLLAQMNHGAENVVCTERFGNALGLEHDEMQDPNEFARLLFDRMHESFQKSALASASCNSGSTNDRSATALAELLPSLFRGICTYETKCCKCEKKSKRSENFMELTLPIVKPGDRRVKETSIARSRIPIQKDNVTTAGAKMKSKKKGRPRKGSDATDATENEASNQQDSRDVTVQGCLDAYLFPEMLEDDNQFYCNNCAMKCDAIRSVSLSRLPPVLNILLARYVFDRLTFMKKKLSDRVLLPRTLMVPRKRNIENGGKDVDEINDEVYVLCAIQNHRGASAYGGHYVAEAMDWTTGVWYDYNDEEVKLLPSGPNCSYVPASSDDDSTTSTLPVAPVEASTGGKIKRTPSLRGSSDAYSLFYVERSFLAKTAARHILRSSPKLKISPDPCVVEANAITKMTQQREESYRLMNEMSLEKKLTNDRMRQRKSEIETRLFSALSENNSTDTTSIPVWVDGNVLLRFFSCLDGMDDTLKRQPLLHYRKLLCSHGNGGLHPRVAKRGKFLPRNVYDIVVSLLRQEQIQFTASSENRRGTSAANDQENHADDISDCVISPSSSLFCHECVETYRSELAERERSLSLVLKLYDALDSKVNDIDAKSLPVGQDIYAVSRNFVTTFKKHAERVMKVAMSPQVVCEGIDLLDLSFLPAFCSDAPVVVKQGATGKADEAATGVGEALDPMVNGKISCSHNRSNVLGNKRSVRFVSASVWSILVQLFPRAIVHRRYRRRLDNGEIQDLSNDEPFDGKCLQCDLDKAGNSQMLGKLQSWGHRCISAAHPSQPKLHRLYNWDASSDGVVRHINYAKDGTFRLVHHDDVQTWRTAIDITQTLLSTKKKDKSTSDEAKGRLFRSTPLRFKSLLCKAHGCTIISDTVIKDMALQAISGQPSFDQDMDTGVAACICQVELLSSEEYRAFIDSLNQLQAIILPGEELELLSSEESNKIHPTTIARFKPQETHHAHPHAAPAPSAAPSAAPTVALPVGDVFLVSSNPPHCKDTRCTDGFVASAIALRPLSNGIGRSHGVQVVEPKDDGKIDVKVHELEGHVEVDAALSFLLPEINTAALHGGDANNGEMATRRSSRKRKTRNDGITTHEFRLYPHDNLAKLKLLLLERANKKLFDQEWRLVSLRAESVNIPLGEERDHGDGDGQGQGQDQGGGNDETDDATLLLSTTELGNDEKALCDHVGDVKMANGENAAEKAEQDCLKGKTLHLILRYRDDGGGNGRKSKRLTTEEKEERRKAEDSLMAALTDIANIPDSFQSGVATENGAQNRTRRRRREERGFRGTFLHGMSTSANADDGAISSKEVSPGASPKAVTTECIILDASAAKEQSKTNTIEEVPTASPAMTNAPFTKEHQLTPPLALDISDVIVINDDDDDNSSIMPPENEEASAPEESSGIATSSSAPSSESERPPELQVSDVLQGFEEGGCAAINVDEKVYVKKSKHNLSRNALLYTAPIRTPSAPPLVNEDGTHLCCGLATLERDTVIEFVSKMKKKPDTFWEDASVEFEAMGAFQFLLPKATPYDHARHLYRNFADGEKMECSCKVGKLLPISRREMDIMLFFIKQRKSSRDCHRYMPYRQERNLRYVFEIVKKGYHDGAVDKRYMKNVIAAVERVVSIETNTPSDV